MIDQICIKRILDRGTEREEIRVWISGIPFRADSSNYVESIVRRVASANDIAILDLRAGKPDDAPTSPPLAMGDEDAAIEKVWKELRQLEGKLPHALGMVIGEALDHLRPSIARIRSGASPSHISVALTAEQLCSSPLIEELVPRGDEWAACEVMQERYDLIKTRVHAAFGLASSEVDG